MNSYMAMQKRKEQEEFIGSILVAVIGFSFLGFALYYLIPYETQMRVTGHSWSRTQFVERYQKVTEEGWDVPAGGEIIGSQTRQRSTRTYVCGEEEYTETVNGKIVTKTRDKTCTEPVNDTWYIYTVFKWIEVRSIHKEGTDSRPVSPDVSDINDRDLVNPERLGRFLEIYNVFFEKDGKSFRFEATYSVWNKLKVEETYTVSVNRLGMINYVKFNT